MAAYVDTDMLSRYSAGIASGHFDRDLTIAERAEVVRMLTLATGRLNVPGRWRTTVQRAALCDAIDACAGDASIVAYQRALDIVANV